MHMDMVELRLEWILEIMLLIMLLFWLFEEATILTTVLMENEN